MSESLTRASISRRSPLELPEFPWDTLADARQTAADHPDGIINLSVGTPVDRVAPAIRSALADASDSPGYPQTRGSGALRASYASYLDRAHGVSVDPSHVLPTIGLKELVASLPSQLGVQPGWTVVIPELAYPTYEVGARIAGASVVRADEVTQLADDRIAMVWVNSPSNPTGQVRDAQQLRAIVAWARERGIIVASDECYLDLGWEVTPQSILHPDICGGDFTGLLAIHSLSKRCNLAGYRLGFVAGDTAVVDELVALRKHLGLIVPGPVQAAGVAALENDAPVLAQRRRYGQRREQLMAAFDQAGFTVEDSPAGLYLWCTRGEAAMDSVDWLAERGILVAPGTFYGPKGQQHIRVALTNTDERIAAAAARLAH